MRSERRAGGNDLMMKQLAVLPKKKVLFLCTHNSARSQMAEGLLRAIRGDGYEAFSAGIFSSHVDPRAIRVMHEIGIDISSQRSKTVEEFQDTIFDLAVTVCDRAKQACPIVSSEHEGLYPKARMVIHHSFEDPAQASGSEEHQLSAFRKIRDEIEEWISKNF